jgi:hypothetical protein
MAVTRKEAYDLVDVLAPDLDERGRVRFVNEFTASAEVLSVGQAAEGDNSGVDSRHEKLIDSSCQNRG